jgi:DNA-binding transcriptional LysR family regulator
MADLNALVVFAKVVEANSFSEAARRLKAPISTVSRRIAELEDQLGVRLLDRSTRSVRLTELGAAIYEHAVRSAELCESLESIISHRMSEIRGTLRLSAPPSISDTVLAPLITAFQAAYPNVRFRILVTERLIDHITDGVDLAFRFGDLKDSSLVARRILTYRHQLLASPAYLEGSKPPQLPRDLLDHRLLLFSHWRPNASWAFIHRYDRAAESLAFQPFLAMNDYAGIAAALTTGTGIGELPPVVRPELLRSGKLVEVMPDWHFRTYDLSLVHLGNRHMSKPCRLFKEFVTQMAPTLFPALPV